MQLDEASVCVNCEESQNVKLIGILIYKKDKIMCLSQ